MKLHIAGLKLGKTYTLNFSPYDVYGTFLFDTSIETVFTTRDSDSIYIKSFNASCENGTVSYKAEFGSYLSEDKPLYMIVAAYGKNNSLIGAGILNGSVDSEGLICSNTFNVTAVPEKIKCFAWDSAQNIKPYCKEKTIEVNNN